MTRGVRVGLLAALAAAWLAAAWWLWHTSVVPSSLRLPHLSPSVFFTPAQIHRATSFDHVLQLLWIAGVIVELLVFVVYARRGPRFVRESAAGPIGTGMLLGMLGFALLWLAELPFDVVSLWWERRHGLARDSYLKTIFGGWIALGVKFALLCVALGIVMGLARLIGDWWWIVAAPFFGALVAFFAFISPYLIPTHRLDDPQLRAAVQTIEQRDGLHGVPVVVQHVSSNTSLPNAESVGFGPTRRVVLWDTLLRPPFSEREVRVVIGHELGHVTRNHIIKSIGWYILFALPVAFFVSRLARRRGGMTRPEAVPLALLALVAAQLVVLPFRNAVTRHMEAEADWMALQTTRDPRAATGLFKEFVPTTMSEPNPPTWDYLFLEDHPTVMQRLAMVQAWRTYAAERAQLP